MIILVTFLLSILASMLVVRTLSVALTMTGMPQEIATFQALSAFSGAGFTTSESESITSHPTRRRIAAMGIRIGSAGVVAVLASGAGSVLQAIGDDQLVERSIVALVGLTVLGGLSISRHVDHAIRPMLRAILARTTTLEDKDYTALLRLSRGFEVAEVVVEPDSWLSDRTLRELDLPAEGLRVLGLEREGAGYIAVPTPDTRLMAGDVLVLYGPTRGTVEIAKRARGDQSARDAAVRREEARARAQPACPGAER